MPSVKRSETHHICWICYQRVQVLYKRPKDWCIINHKGWNRMTIGLMYRFCVFCSKRLIYMFLNKCREIRWSSFRNEVSKFKTFIFYNLTDFLLLSKPYALIFTFHLKQTIFSNIYIFSVLVNCVSSLRNGLYQCVLMLMEECWSIPLFFHVCILRKSFFLELCIYHIFIL